MFVTGACVFPQYAGKNPTGPVGALAYWAVDTINSTPFAVTSTFYAICAA